MVLASCPDESKTRLGSWASESFSAARRSSCSIEWAATLTDLVLVPLR